MQDDRLEQAARLVKSGKMNDARTILELILKEDRKNIPAWRWYAETLHKTSDKVRVWEYCLRYNPSNQEAEQAIGTREKTFKHRQRYFCKISFITMGGVGRSRSIRNYGCISRGSHQEFHSQES